MKGKYLKKGCTKGIIFTVFLCAYLLIFFSGYALAGPAKPPPPGKVWVEVDGKWTLVIEPPGVGPYIWVNGEWVIDPTPPPPGSEWVPGHWAGGSWVNGCWKPVPLPGPGAKWVPGYWEHGRWIPGHWGGPLPRGRHWVPGHWGRGRHWVPGHWK